MVAIKGKEKRYSIEEYFALEEKAFDKHEFHNGKIIPMAGASIAHNQIQVNFISALRALIEKNNLEYFVFGSDVKIRIEKFNKALYPDAIVVCKKPEYYGKRTDTITNPLLVVEVLSESTKIYFGSDKFMLYRSLPVFKEYVLIEQSKPLVQAYYKQDEKDNLWKISAATGLDAVVPLLSLGFDLPLSKVYWKVPELSETTWKG
jgi:Uma2 family endonuclease